MWNPFKRIEKKSAPPTVPASDPSLIEFLGMFPGSGDNLATYESQIRKGVMANPYVSKAIDLRAHSVAVLDPILYDDKGQIIETPSHPLRKLINEPNPRQTWAELIYELETHYSLNGNAYLYIEKERGTPRKLWAIPPDRMTPQTKNDIFDPVAYWSINTGSETRTADPTELIHIHTMLGPDGITGISPLQSAWLSVKAQTSAREWNNALMDNSACPSVALTTEQELTEEQFQGLRQGMQENHGGKKNAGSIMVLDKGLVPASLGGFNARDMDYTQGIVLAAREIAIALDVPPELIGDSTNKTYNSMGESIRQYANTVNTLASAIYGGITKGLAKYYAGVSRIGYDLQQIDGMKNAPSISEITAADWLTTNEKRAMYSYEAVEGGDVILTPMGKVPLSEVSTDISDLMNEDE